MNTEQILGMVATGLFFLFVFWVGGAGVLPLLKSITAYTEEKREMAKKGILAVDGYFADSPSVVGNVIHEVASGLTVKATDPAIVALANSELLAKIVEQVNILLPHTPEEVSADMLAKKVNEALSQLAKMTDQVKGNVLVEVVPPAPPLDTSAG